MTTRELYAPPREMSPEVAERFEAEPPRYKFAIIPKLSFLYTMGEEDDWTGNCEFIVLKGGRGGGKSLSVAQALILLSRRETTRILCCREVQKSMGDSVYKMLVDWITRMHLQNEFYITKTSIVNKITGTDFIFMGMEVAARDSSDTLKSLEGVKYVWYEESQTATLNSLEKLSPTIRQKGRKIIFTMNPRTEHDSVVKYLKNKKKVYWCEINYIDNVFCPQVLVDEAEEMKELDYDRWMHVWMGQPIPDDSSRIILPYSWLNKCIDLDMKDPGDAEEQYKLRDFKQVGGFDIAEGTTTAHDKNAFALRRGPTVTHVEEWQIGQVHQSCDHIHSLHPHKGFAHVWYDGVGVGVAAKSEFDRRNKVSKLPYKVYGFKGGSAPYGPTTIFTGEGVNAITNRAMFANAKAQSWWNLRMRLENSMRILRGEKIDRKDYYLSFSSQIPDLDSIFLELAQATYEEDNSGRIKVDKAPGMNTIVVDGKDKERKSPNKADSIVYSFVDDIERGLRAHQPQSRKAKVYG